MGPTVPPGMILHVGRMFGRGGSHWGRTSEEAGPTVPLVKNLNIFMK